jgi:hypothetical protein
MRTRKKPSKRSLIKKLQNGGTGDPKKPVVTQSATGFPLYREFGELTATPTTPFYTTTDQRGYYQGIPIGLGEAEVVADSGDALGSVDRVVEELGGGIFGDYAAIPASDREKFEGGVRDAINEGSKIAAIATSPLLAVGAAPILASGLQGYSALSQLPLITVKGQTAVTVGGGLDDWLRSFRFFASRQRRTAIIQTGIESNGWYTNITHYLGIWREQGNTGST